MSAVSLVDNLIMVLMYIFAAKNAGINVPAMAIVPRIFILPHNSILFVST